MFRPAARALARAPAVAARTPASTRLISTGPTPKSRSFKSTILRLGLAGGAIYYYNTNSAFAKEPSFSVLAHLQKDNASEASTQTLDSITPKIREERAAAQQLEDEAGQQAAFNPETGEINWDCPCLGGMAHGPCGEEFKAAFSCFVYSQEEPKGIECIERFKDMQNCFRQHPDIYGAELEDEEEVEGGAPSSPEQSPEQPPAQSVAAVEQEVIPVAEEQPVAEENGAIAADGAEILVPKAAHDEKSQ